MYIKRGVDKAVKNAFHTEDRDSYMGLKDTCLTCICTERVTGLKGVTVDSVEALTTALIFFQLYSCGDMQSSGAARNSTMEFLQSIMAQTTARIIEQERRSRMLVVNRAEAE